MRRTIKLEIDIDDKTGQVFEIKRNGRRLKICHNGIDICTPIWTRTINGCRSEIVVERIED